MNQTDDLGRALTVWFADTAAPRVPDFTDDILRLTAGTPQRPRWTFPERWLPMSVITLGRQTIKPVPWRTVGLLALLALLIATVVAVYVGSQTRLPAPFGLANNGLVAYASGGDIFTVDPVTGARKAIVTGTSDDYEPRWSRDGTRLVFLRASAAGDALGIVDPKVPDSLVTTRTLPFLDSDSVAWSPDGHSILIRADQDGSKALFVVDAANGEATPVDLDVAVESAYWRPPDGRQVMVFGGVAPDLRLYLLDLKAGSRRDVVIPVGSGPLRMNGWTPDGQRFLYQRGEFDQLPMATHVIDVRTGDEVVIDAGYGHVSNDGTRMVALDAAGRMCVAKLGAGAPCVVIGQPTQAFHGQNDAGVQWAPNDEWIIARPPFGEDGKAKAFLVDPDGPIVDQPSWVTDGAESWQRLAR